MGVRELVTYIVKSQPQCLVHDVLRHVDGGEATKTGGGGGSAIVVDYVLVDVTNILQTWRPSGQRARDILLSPRIVVRRAVMLVVDGPRTHRGTQREQRSFLQTSESEAFMSTLAREWADALAAEKNRGVAAAAGGRGEESAPSIVVCGRQVEGEGDFKLLALHRRLALAAMTTPTSSHARRRPTFLVASEDSDLFSGLLMGPNPQDTMLLTTLHSTLSDAALIRLSVVADAVAETIQGTSKGNGTAAAATGTHLAVVTVKTGTVTTGAILLLCIIWQM